MKVDRNVIKKFLKMIDNFLLYYKIEIVIIVKLNKRYIQARLAQSVEHETLNLRVVGSSPTLGELIF
jgi:hypothetical protein